MTTPSMDVGRAQWDALHTLKCLRETVDRHPEARAEIEEEWANEAFEHLMAIVGFKSIERNKAARARAREAA